VVDSKKRKMGEKEALVLAGQVDAVYATRGSRVIHLDLKTEKPDAATLRALLIGPSGNLRAPTLRAGWGRPSWWDSTRRPTRKSWRSSQPPGGKGPTLSRRGRIPPQPAGNFSLDCAEVARPNAPDALIAGRSGILRSVSGLLQPRFSTGT
jgi:hypothetical protein